jgi:hypothetical protein
MTTLRRFCAISGLAFVMAAPGARAQEEVADGRISSAVWGVSLTAPRYRVWEDHPLRGYPHFVAAGNWVEDGCSVSLSLLAVLVEDGVSPAECRATGSGNPEPLRADDAVSVRHLAETPVAITLLDRKVATGIIQSQLYGYWARDESCFELHVSSLQCSGFDKIAMPVLESVALEPRPEVNVETVAVGRALGLEPENWKVHQVIAGEYLHNFSPKKPARARAYYESALSLSPGEIGFDDRWTILAGIGLSWLFEDNGESAIAPLAKAVEMARSEPGAKRELGESLYNLACAYSLAGDVEEACEAAAEWTTGLDERERKQQLKSMRADPQLEAMLESGCPARS